jgi:hypothetical protein
VAEDDYADEDDAYEAYHSGYDEYDLSAGAEGGDEPVWSSDDDPDPVYEEFADESETARVITTSMTAFAEDRHSYVERPHVRGPWQEANQPNDDVEDSPQDPAYEPLDLGNEQGLSAFRSRLFTSTSDDLAQIDQTGRVARTPISVPRKPRDEREQRFAIRPVEPDALLDDPQDAMYEPEIDPDFDVRALVGQQVKLLDMTIAVAPDTPRQCVTCRSYRASEQGERGWCTNSWAFTHRQMVNADDLACQSSIGCWWLPADKEVWLEDDVDASYRSTPRVDRLVAHLDPVRRVAER